jgi:signal recognition particle subunit SRP54
MGDVVGLVEQVQTRVDRQAAERMADKVKKGRELNLQDFKEQLQQITNMGGLESLLDKMPGVKPGALAASGFDPKIIRRQIALIDSMTPRERRFPATIDGSRKRRIAGGAGLQVQDINRLLKQHKQLVKTMKRVKKGGLGGIAGMLGGAMPGRGPLGRRK